MSDDTQQPENFSADEASAAGANWQDLVNGLDFTPSWARGSSDRPAAVSYSPERDASSGRSRRDKPRRPGDRPPREHRAPRPGGASHAPESGRPPRPDGRSYPRREPRTFLPVDVSFIPDRDRLGAVVRQLHAVKRAFPLPYLAQLFLDKPAHHCIKLEAKPVTDGVAVQFFQDRESRVVFLSREELNDYLLRTHIEKHFERVEETVEPPAGNFVCVGQCKRTGMLLGPPNYHGYNERMAEVHRTHCPQMTLDQYRNQIDMVRDPAVIERWKDECRTRVRYRLKDGSGQESTLTLTQAEHMFREKFTESYVLTGGKVIMPATAMAGVSDERLRQVIISARNREDRFPFSMMLAVRPAFRRMKLDIFKAGKDETFITAITPKPFDAEHAIAPIKEMIALITAHPGCNRTQLMEKLCPGKNSGDPEVAEKMGPLVWLVDKGHIIEFFNGTYAIPGHLRMAASVPTEKPQDHHHPELNAAPTAPASESTPPPPPDHPAPASSVDSPANGEPSQY